MGQSFFEDFLPLLNRVWWQQHLAQQAERAAAVESARRGRRYVPLREPAPYPTDVDLELIAGRMPEEVLHGH